MSLNIHLDINGKPFGYITVTPWKHVDDGGTVRHEYYYHGSLGTSSGSIYHRPADGATTLAGLALDEAIRNLGRSI